MKKSKEEKAKAKLAALLGIDMPEQKSAVEEHDIKMEAEAALEYIENPRTFTHKECKLCGRTFATRGAPVAYCSNDCRIKTFEQRLGIRWSPDRRPEDRWGFMGEPLVVSPEALVVIDEARIQEQQRIQRLRQLAAEDNEGRFTEPDPDTELDPATLDILKDLGLT